MTSPDQMKTALRTQARAARRAAAGPLGADFSRAFLAAFPDVTQHRVAGYWPIADEADVVPLLTAMAERGTTVCLPVVVAKASPLEFRRWLPGDDLVPGPHGTAHPGKAAPLVTPTLLLVPLLAFDRRGGRLGYGGGYYDRTLAALRQQGSVLAVGIAYRAQEFPELPLDAFDQRLDWIVTEFGAREALP